MTVTDSRKTARKHLASLIEASLVTNLHLVQVVYAFQAGDLNGQSPVISVCSGGTFRERESFDEDNYPTFYIDIHVFVLYSDGKDWTEDLCEDRLDDIEEAIGKVISDNQHTQYWEALTQEEPTSPDGLDVGGQEYRHELLRIKVE